MPKFLVGFFRFLATAFIIAILLILLLWAAFVIYTMDAAGGILNVLQS